MKCRLQGSVVCLQYRMGIDGHFWETDIKTSLTCIDNSRVHGHTSPDKVEMKVLPGPFQV